MKTFSKPSDAIKWTKDKLFNHGYVVKTEKWQGIPFPDDMLEIMNHSFQFTIPPTIEELVNEVKPNLEWADEHFEERVGGSPLNPPPSHERWPFAQKNNHQFGGDEKFSHSYPERIWPKYAAIEGSEPITDLDMEGIKNPNKIFIQKYPLSGIRFNYGDFEDVVKLMEKEPYTRQAYLPMWFPEDTGVVHGERVPCSIGWHFIRRGEYLHVVYHIRSCDYVRHFRDDIYLACRKLFWLLERLKVKDPSKWEGVIPGYFAMHITSLHCFNKEKGILKQSRI